MLYTFTGKVLNIPEIIVFLMTQPAVKTFDSGKVLA